MVKKDSGKRTNQLWRAHHMAQESVREVRKLGAYFAELDQGERPFDPKEVTQELREAYKLLEVASSNLTEIYHKYGGTI